MSGRSDFSLTSEALQFYNQKLFPKKITGKKQGRTAKFNILEQFFNIAAWKKAHKNTKINYMALYYRRKILLALLEAFGGKLSKLSLQKLLLILTLRQESPSYDFVPYKYGAFSFQSYMDMGVLEKEKVLSTTDKVVALTENTNFFDTLKTNDRILINNLVREFPKANSTDLIKYTYEKYPYYALKSTLKEYITNETKQWLSDNLKDDNIITLFTIGYEGRTLEKYLNDLLRNNIKVLIDVRKNALSMKYGFSKNTLKKAIESLGIQYVHIPTLGIESDKRQNLVSLEDYYKLFDEYEKDNLSHNDADLEKVLNILEANKKVALTCFEYDKENCHRGRIAQKLAQRKDWKYKVKHI